MDVVLSRVAAKVTVQQAPDQSRISLEVIQHSDPELLLIRQGRLWLGDDTAGNEVVYRVTGWDADTGALVIDRERP
jgi:hypothetical protein